MPYTYELHCHSQEGSACSRFPAMEMVHFYKERGYDGIMLSDHFTGSTTVPADATWQERIDRHYGIYEKMAEEGRKIGLDVFFGIEYSVLADYHNFKRATGNDFLFLGLTKEWLLEHEDAFQNDPRETFDAVHAAGGFIIHAHPFAQDYYIDCIRLFPAYEDAVEIINGGRSDDWNAMALLYAEHYDLPMTAGSDLHHADRGDTLACIETEVPCHTISALIEEIRNKRTTARRNPK